MTERNVRSRATLVRPEHTPTTHPLALVFAFLPHLNVNNKESISINAHKSENYPNLTIHPHIRYRESGELYLNGEAGAAAKENRWYDSGVGRLLVREHLVKERRRRRGRACQHDNSQQRRRRKRPRVRRTNRSAEELSGTTPLLLGSEVDGGGSVAVANRTALDGEAS